VCLRTVRTDGDGCTEFGMKHHGSSEQTCVKQQRIEGKRAACLEALRSSKCVFQ
jgi:hypothetical protein